ncbi:hypothetical protein QT318_17360 [Escherichia coli]|nr:hypothetical protein [Escherichia coli]
MMCSRLRFDDGLVAVNLDPMDSGSVTVWCPCFHRCAVAGDIIRDRRR